MTVPDATPRPALPPVQPPVLSTAQWSCLEALPFAGCHVVSGPPGSGKSLLATHRAVQLALTGRRTVLLSRSNLLRQQLAEALDELAIPEAPVEAATVHAWVRDRFGRTARRAEDGWFDWPSLILHLAGAPDAGATDEQRPHLVVDEGQDLPPGLWPVLRLSAASVTVFADECQRLTETNSTLAEIAGGLGRSATRVTVAGNHRNTREIARLADSFRVGGGPPVLPGRSGPAPVLRAYPGPRHIAEHVAELAAARPRERVGIVVGSLRGLGFDLLGRLEKAGLRHAPQLYSSANTGPRSRYRALDLRRPGVVIVHRASVKGLEFDTVVIPDTEVDSATDPTSATLRMAYYVMITRARRQVVLGWQGSRPPAHLGDLPERTDVGK